jgi:hypothetical protein
MEELVEDYAKGFPAKVQEWLIDNEHIWDAFVREAFKAHSAGRKHYSARTIIEFLRHHSMMSEKSGEWKINNDVVPYLARLIAKVYPNTMGSFFEYRTQQ